MAKTKTPFLSLDSSGTVGGVLTSQKRGRDTILRTTPTPTDPYSLAQAYQRWDYKDYAYLWTLLSNSEKQVYRTAASRYHITGFSYWMRLRLKELTNLVGRWHLDERSGATAHDSSRNTNDGIIIGPSPIPGIIDYAYLFDGLNDFINCGDHTSLDITGPLTLELWWYTETIAAGVAGLIARDFPAANRNYILQRNANKAQFVIWISTVAKALRGDTILALDTWYHSVAVYNLTDLRVYLNGNLDCTPLAATGAIDNTDVSLFIGAKQQAGTFHKGGIDEARIYNRALDPTEIKRHSERRYP